MDQAFFIHNFGEGETSIMSSRKEDGKGFLASHPPFSLPTKPYGNSDRGFPASLPQECFSCDKSGSFTLSDYNSTYLDGCSPPMTSSDASTHLSVLSPVNYCNTKRLLQKRYSNIKKKGVRLLHSFYRYTLSGLSMLNYNRYLVLH